MAFEKTWSNHSSITSLRKGGGNVWVRLTSPVPGGPACQEPSEFTTALRRQIGPTSVENCAK